MGGRKWLSGLALAACVAGGGAAPGTAISGPAQALAGRYSDHFPNALVSGETYASDDVAEVVPVSGDAAYVRISLQFYNGHSCDIAGVAEAEGDRLVYHEGKALLPGDAPCTLHISRIAANLAIDDDHGSCKPYCGARGSLTGQTLPWKSRRVITYLGRLRGSSEYKEAVAAWRKRHGE